MSDAIAMESIEDAGRETVQEGAEQVAEQASSAGTTQTPLSVDEIAAQIANSYAAYLDLNSPTKSSDVSGVCVCVCVCVCVIATEIIGEIEKEREGGMPTLLPLVCRSRKSQRPQRTSSRELTSSRVSSAR